MNAPMQAGNLCADTQLLMLAQQTKRTLREGRERVVDAFKDHGSVDRLLTDLRRNVDQAVISTAKRLGLPKQAACVAVGGYGRGELFPHSDVDLLLLLHDSPDEQLQRRISDFVGACWDLGLEVGHSVRTIEDCIELAAGDITIQTSLAEARFLCGSRRLFGELVEGLREHTDAKQFFNAKVFEQKQRYAKYQETPYSLEPNCKESPGGLRDLQLVIWVARVAGFGSSWQDLFRAELITREELLAFVRYERLLKSIRAHLHLLANRREDRLVFDVQTALALDMGFAASGARRASEMLMQRYYIAAKVVMQITTIVMQNIEERLFQREQVPAIPINERFQNVNDLLDIRDEHLFQKHPTALLEVFLVMMQHPEIKEMSARTLRAIWHDRELINADFRSDERHHRLFIQILQEPRGIVHGLRRMNQWGVLGRYLPGFRRIIGQMQHDLFHVYTVDQHIMQVIRNLRRFTMAEHAHEYPFCSNLIANFDKPWLLYAAALFHDIAKGRGGDHSELGRVDARRFCREHGLDREETGIIDFLVRHHLTMSQVAQKQDLSDPDVIAAFAKTVGTERRLTALYLLTVADVRGTSPKVWNAWKAKLLEDLFRMTRRVLGGATPNAHAELEARQEDARRILRLYAFSPSVHEELWKQLDIAFFLRQDAQTVAWLTRSLHYRINADKPVVKARLAQIGEGLQVAVYVKDQTDLFARICGYFDNKRFSILDAKVHTTRHQYALDTFLIVDANAATDEPLDYRALISMVEHELAEVIAAHGPLPQPSRARLSRQTRHFPIQPTVSLTPDDRQRFHLLSVTAADRSGLLYSIARVLGQYRVNMHTAKIMTLGERVEDVFLVDGAALANAKTQIQLETDLLDALTIK
jgi:[protein-PII] uridylyltransferase